MLDKFVKRLSCDDNVTLVGFFCITSLEIFMFQLFSKCYPFTLSTIAYFSTKQTLKFWCLNAASYEFS